MKLTGRTAIEYAKQHGETLNKYQDPIEEHRTGVSIEEAEEILREDPALIYINIPAPLYRMVNEDFGDITDYETYENWLASLHQLCDDNEWERPDLYQVSDGRYLDRNTGETVLEPADDYPELTQDRLDAIAQHMDDDLREALHAELFGYTPGAFLTSYLSADPRFPIHQFETED